MHNKMDREQNIVRQIMQSEITWIGMIIAGVWTAISTIIIPINTIQTQLVQIQQNQVDNIKFQKQTLATEDSYDSRISVLESEIKK